MEKIKVFIDPGHGGPKDRYNRGPEGYIEADGVLKISKYLRDELETTGKFEVKLSRETDIGIPVRERGVMAAAFGADVAISQHTNASNGTATGALVFRSIDIPTDQQFASDMAQAIAESIGIKNRGARYWESSGYPGEDYLGFIDAAQDGGCKHVFLVESAFHDNPEEEAILLKDENLKKIAQAQAKVIFEYYGINPSIKEKHPIMGDAVATIEQMVGFVESKNKEPKLSVSLHDLCKFYLEEGKIEGVRGDVALAQACLETSFFTFKGLVQAEWNNYAALGVTGGKDEYGRAIGVKFTDAKTGVRAHIQHLKTYASKDPLRQESVDPRFKYVTRESAPNWEDLNARWKVPGEKYGENIYAIYEQILSFVPVVVEATKEENSLLTQTKIDNQGKVIGSIPKPIVTSEQGTPSKPRAGILKPVAKPSIGAIALKALRNLFEKK